MTNEYRIIGYRRVAAESLMISRLHSPKCSAKRRLEEVFLIFISYSVCSSDMLLCLCPEETAAEAGEAASDPVEDWSRGEFSICISIASEPDSSVRAELS